MEPSAMNTAASIGVAAQSCLVNAVDVYNTARKVSVDTTSSYDFEIWKNNTVTEILDCAKGKLAEFAANLQLPSSLDNNIGRQQLYIAICGVNGLLSKEEQERTHINAPLATSSAKAVVSESTLWECVMCTFKNNVKNRACDVCHSKRPKKVKPEPQSDEAVPQISTLASNANASSHAKVVLRIDAIDDIFSNVSPLEFVLEKLKREITLRLESSSSTRTSPDAKIVNGFDGKSNIFVECVIAGRSKGDNTASTTIPPSSSPSFISSSSSSSSSSTLVDSGMPVSSSDAVKVEELKEKSIANVSSDGSCSISISSGSNSSSSCTTTTCSGGDSLEKLVSDAVKVNQSISTVSRNENPANIQHDEKNTSVDFTGDTKALSSNRSSDDNNNNASRSSSSSSSTAIGIASRSGSGVQSTMRWVCNHCNYNKNLLRHKNCNACYAQRPSDFNVIEKARQRRARGEPQQQSQQSDNANEISPEGRTKHSRGNYERLSNTNSNSSSRSIISNDVDPDPDESCGVLQKPIEDKDRENPTHCAEDEEDDNVKDRADDEGGSVTGCDDLKEDAGNDYDYSSAGGPHSHSDHSGCESGSGSDSESGSGHGGGNTSANSASSSSDSDVSAARIRRQKAAEAAQEGIWTCARCTLENHCSVRHCAVCGGIRTAIILPGGEESVTNDDGRRERKDRRRQSEVNSILAGSKRSGKGKGRKRKPDTIMVLSDGNNEEDKSNDFSSLSAGVLPLALDGRSRRKNPLTAEEREEKEIQRKAVRAEIQRKRYARLKQEKLERKARLLEEKEQQGDRSRFGGEEEGKTDENAAKKSKRFLDEYVETVGAGISERQQMRLLQQMLEEEQEDLTAEVEDQGRVKAVGREKGGSKKRGRRRSAKSEEEVTAVSSPSKRTQHQMTKSNSSHRRKRAAVAAADEGDEDEEGGRDDEEGEEGDSLLVVTGVAVKRGRGKASSNNGKRVSGGEANNYACSTGGKSSRGRKPREAESNTSASPRKRMVLPSFHEICLPDTAGAARNNAARQLAAQRAAESGNPRKFPQIGESHQVSIINIPDAGTWAREKEDKDNLDRANQYMGEPLWFPNKELDVDVSTYLEAKKALGALAQSAANTAINSLLQLQQCSDEPCYGYKRTINVSPSSEQLADLVGSRGDENENMSSKNDGKLQTLPQHSSGDTAATTAASSAPVPRKDILTAAAAASSSLSANAAEVKITGTASFSENNKPEGSHALEHEDEGKYGLDDDEDDGEDDDDMRSYASSLGDGARLLKHQDEDIQNTSSMSISRNRFMLGTSAPPDSGDEEEEEEEEEAGNGAIFNDINAREEDDEGEEGECIFAQHYENDTGSVSVSGSFNSSSVYGPQYQDKKSRSVHEATAVPSTSGPLTRRGKDRGGELYGDDDNNNIDNDNWHTMIAPQADTVAAAVVKRTTHHSAASTAPVDSSTVLELYLRQFPNAQVLALKQLLDADYDIIRATQKMLALYKEFVTDPMAASYALSAPPSSSSSSSSFVIKTKATEASDTVSVKEEEEEEQEKARQRSASVALTDAVKAANKKRAYFDYILPVLTEKQRSQFASSLARNWDDWRKIKSNLEGRVSVSQLQDYFLCEWSTRYREEQNQERVQQLHADQMKRWIGKHKSNSGIPMAAIDLYSYHYSPRRDGYGVSSASGAGAAGDSSANRKRKRSTAAFGYYSRRKSKSKSTRRNTTSKQEQQQKQQEEEEEEVVEEEEQQQEEQNGGLPELVEEDEKEGGRAGRNADKGEGGNNKHDEENNYNDGEKGLPSVTVDDVQHSSSGRNTNSIPEEEEQEAFVFHNASVVAAVVATAVVGGEGGGGENS